LFEGEFKYLSAYEEGLAGLGLPSFFVYCREGDTRRLLPEIRDAIKSVRPEKIFFFGDSDTATNLQFSASALFLTQTVRPLEVYLPRLSIAGPKGFDELKSQHNSAFASELDRLISSAYRVDPDISYLLLHRDLIAIAQDDFKLLVPALASKHKERLLKLCAQARLQK